jgi:DNA-binding MarR family transcriptional regulator
MNIQEISPTEARFSDLMKRVRRLGLETLNSEREASPAQMALIEWIALNPGCGVKDISDGICLAPPTVSIGVKKMEQNGVIERKPNPSDARSVQFFLTRRGQKIFEHHLAFQRRKFQKLLSGLSQQEKNTLIDLLERALQSAEMK